MSNGPRPGIIYGGLLASPCGARRLHSVHHARRNRHPAAPEGAASATRCGGRSHAAIAGGDPAACAQDWQPTCLGRRAAGASGGACGDGSDALWKLAQGGRSGAEMMRYDELLEQSVAGALGDAERSGLEMLRREADRFMLIKAHAAVLLRWRSHDVPVR